MPTRVTAVRLLAVCAIALGLACPATTQEDGRTATFYGGYHRINLSPDDSHIEISFTFKTTYDSGLLAIARLQGSGYLALGLMDGQLQAILQYPEATVRVDAGAVSPEISHEVNLHLHASTLNVSLGSRTVSGVVPSAVSFKDIYFGGVYSFFAPVFRRLNITEYFVGCMTDASVNGRVVEFGTEVSYGIRPGCCPNPTPVEWCFTENSKFSFRTILHRNSFSKALQVAFLLETQEEDGMVLFSVTDSNVVIVELFRGSLLLHVNSWTVQCPGLVSDGNWHSLEMDITLSSIQCRLDGAVNSTSAPRHTIPKLSAPFYIGNVEVDAFTQTLGPVDSQSIVHTTSSFVGCLQRFQFSGVDLIPSSELNNFSPNFSEPCLSVTEPPPPSTPPTTPTPLTPDNCPILAYRDHLKGVVLETRPLTVDEGQKITLTTSTLHFPSLETLAAEVKGALEDSIVFHVIEEPADGVLARVLGSRTSTFSYEEIKSKQIIYRHTGAERDSDSASLVASFECNDQEINSTAPALLSFDIRLLNDPPAILRQKEITIAVGTRRVITPDVVTISDPDSGGPDKITFTVQDIDTCNQCCQQCVLEKAGRIERTMDPGIEHIYFTQEDVNNGDISFQHFSGFGLSTVKIYLSVTDEFAGSIFVALTVNPYVGHINLTSNSCLYLVEGMAEPLEPRHLNSATDFEDQGPILTYEVVRPPQYGWLETVWQVKPDNESTWQWVRIDESESENSFTQADIDSGHIRYVHDNSTQPVVASDSFQFQLQSTNLTGPEGEFCIKIISYETLQQPNIVVEVGSLVVMEGGTTVLGRTALDTSLAPPILIDWLEEAIGIEQLGITFIIPPDLRPHAGELRLDDHALQNNSFSLVELVQGQVTYTHNGSEVHSDSFQFYAEAGDTYGLPIHAPEPTQVMSVPITVTPVNDHPPEIIQDQLIAPSEGGWVVITAEMLRVFDEDLPGDNITIYLRKKSADQPSGTFVFSDDKTVEARSFTMRDIEEGRLLFVHQLNSSADLEFAQSLRVEDGHHVERGSVDVKAVPLTVMASARPLPPSGCLDSTSSKLSFPLSSLNTVNIALHDEGGNDPSRLPSLVIHVAKQPEYGILMLANGSEVSQFSFGDLESERVLYNFSNNIVDTTSDSFHLEFIYGHATSGPIEFVVCIDPVPFPNLERNVGIELPTGGMETIMVDNLLTTDQRGSLSSSLLYHVLSGPVHGVLFDELADDSTLEVYNFTQKDINDAHIAYHHRDTTSDSVEDTFQFKVCTEYACSSVHNFSITLYVAHLSVTNPGFTVQENGNYSITPSVLYAVAPKGYDVTIQIPRGKAPKHGSLNLLLLQPVVDASYFTTANIRNGQLYYIHSGDESKWDSFEFTVQGFQNDNFDASDVPSGASLPDTFKFSGVVNVTILPVNDNPPLKYNLTRNQAVVEGGVLAITDYDLSYHDIDSDAVDNDLRYRLFGTAPYFGDIFLEGSSARVETWTEGDLREGRVFYLNRQIPDPPGGKEVVIFTVSDGLWTSVEYFFIDVKPVILEFDGEAPHTSPFLHLMEGATANISQRNLRYVAANDESLTDADFIYNVTRSPRHGTLSFNNTVAGKFTQEVLQNVSLVYGHDGSNSVKDTFEFTVTVPSRKNAHETFTFMIDIAAIDDDPPQVVGILDPMFVVELSNLTIGNNTLSIWDLDSPSDEQWVNVKCTIVEKPLYGSIQFRELGRDYRNATFFTLFNLVRHEVQYSHQKRGHWSDQFTFNVTDGINSPNDTYLVRFSILPHQVELNKSALRASVMENSATQLTSGHFLVLHPYLREVPGRILVTTLPDHGSLVHSGTSNAVREFTTEDLAAGTIFYQHIGDEIDKDVFVFTYENIIPHGYERMSKPLEFTVEIFPVNDQPPQLVTRSLSIWMGERVALDQTYLNATDLDTPPESLHYSFTPFVYGHIEYAHEVGHAILNFTQADVNAQKVIFVHESGLYGNISFMVTDGSYVSHGSIVVRAERLMLRGQEGSNISVSLGGSVTITREHLHYYTNDLNDIRNPSPRPIYYQVLQAMYGKIVVDSFMETVNFTQADVDEGRVTYVHTAVDVWEPQEFLLIEIWTPLANSLKIVLEVSIEHPHSPISDLAVNELVRVNEGGRVCFSESVLDARNLRYQKWMELGRNGSLGDLSIEYNLTALPSHGVLHVAEQQKSALPITFTQSQLSTVCYIHDGSETQSDGFPFEVKIVSVTGPLGTFCGAVNISVTLENDEKPHLVPTLNLSRTFVDGFKVALGPADLEVTDKDNKPDDIQYKVVGLPDNGDVLVWNEPIKLQEFFTQLDINTGRVQFQPHTVNKTSYFVVTFSDGRHQHSGNISFEVSVVPLTLSLLETAGLSYRQDQLGAAITSDVLNAVTNGLKEDTVFVVTSEPTNGHVKHGDAIYSVGDSFSQANVTTGQIVYSATVFSSHNDSFVVDVKNRDKVIRDVTVPVHVTAWGYVRKDVELNLSSVMSGSLPANLLDLEELSSVTKKLPLITIIHPPQYGFLEMRFTADAVTVKRSTPDEPFTFRYDDLQNGWVHYHWSPPTGEYDPRTSISDSFTVIVAGGNDMQPGEALVELKVFPPSSTAPSKSTPAPTVLPPPLQSPSLSTPSDKGGFSTYALVPILGVFLILLVIIVMVIIFCLTQQKRIRRKWRPKPSPAPSHPYPWSVQPPSSLPPPTLHYRYDFDPTAFHQGGESRSDDPSVMEGMSEYSEAVTTRHSPSAHRGSPLHSNPPLSRPRSARGRSNVSISVSHRSLSSRQSDFSEVSGYYPHAPPIHLQQMHHPLLQPIPVRPMVRSPVRRHNSREGCYESGYLSPIRSLNQSSSSLPRSSTGSGNNCASDVTSGVDTLESASHSGNTVQLQECPTSSTDAPVPSTTTLPALAVATPTPDPSIPDTTVELEDTELIVCDPEVMKLFRSSNPILKKQEYWV